MGEFPIGNALTNSANNKQTCNFQYDDLGRIAGSSTHPGVDCGSKWQQYFTYGAYGNIWKNGSSNFNQGYGSGRLPRLSNVS